jgi:hypothetical protein
MRLAVRRWLFGLSALLLVGASCRSAVPPSPSHGSTRERPRAQPWESDPQEAGALIDWKNSGPRIGERIGQHYFIQTELGVIRTLDGKPDNPGWERWTIQCSSGSDERDPGCVVQRVRIVSGISFSGGPWLTTDFFGTSDKTLQNLRLNWDDGAIDFSMNEFTRPPTEVAVRFECKDRFIHLLSLDANGWGEDVDHDHKGQTKLVPLHFTVPEYTSVLNVPLVFLGMHSAGTRAWREMEATLSPNDQRAWSDVARDQENADIGSETTRYSQELNFQERLAQSPMSSDSQQQLRERLAKSPMSREGQQKIVSFLETHLPQ